MTITSLSVFAVPAQDAELPVALPASLQVFVPESVDALPAGADATIGALRGKTYNTHAIEVAKKEDDAKWKLTPTAADVARLQADVSDLLLVLNYAVAAG